jgi:hypothetical protein
MIKRTVIYLTILINYVSVKLPKSVSKFLSGCRIIEPASVDEAGKRAREEAVRRNVLEQSVRGAARRSLEGGGGEGEGGEGAPGACRAERGHLSREGASQ